MSASRLISFAEAYADLSEFDCIIDARSPAEFAEDHIPGAINCPVLDNEERIKVGTIYKQVSPFEAKKIGAALVAKNIGTHIEQLFLDKPKDWKPLIYCWRGGNRSGAMTHIMSKIGWHAMQLDGGYKGFRRFVNQQLPELTARAHWVVLCGETGTGKSRLLQQLHAAGEQVIDLEELAQHRGSVLGKLPDNRQPSQKFFETEIWRCLNRFDFDRPIYVEAESKKVGNLRVPDAMMEKMRISPCLKLELSLDERIALLSDDYRHFIDNTALLKTQLACLVDLHGKEQIRLWSELAESNQIRELVKQLLLKHYDPAYQKAIVRNFEQVKQAKIYAIQDKSDASYAELAARIIREY
ncbi:tRNA 2-selenouridine(34) synthase MnmH [Undibacterium flavidum]|uniref:tRNA 2-selenouridine(34) synthase MnmH n=1 Tax=Undibacterium flavidum TaxID=2762297 RepID=A0ABR6YD68_9BURK|nr:tRNA 2-selenouridine(34) synthase MnmH [Undibacterium flavidum]MBC3874501.1 tRNA 2-selenouridine(34) synthase MnmH [Undibacterium flavidum]